MNVSFRIGRSAPWIFAVTALAAGFGCKKTAACRPGTLLVTLNCGAASAPAGADHATLTLAEGDFTAAPQTIPLACPQTNHEITISGYAANRTLTATLSIGAAGGGPEQTIVSGRKVTLKDSCTTLNVDLRGDGGAPADADKTDAATGDGPETAAGDTGVVDGDGNLITDGPPGTDELPGIDLPPTPVPDGGLYTNGATCTVDGECASSKCSGGICCEERCDGKCQACAAGTGKCVNVAAGMASNRCASAPNAAGCGETGACDGNGHCALFGTTTVCKPASCDTSGLNHVAASFCDGQGNCLAGQSSDCGAYLCSGGACGQTCTVAANCNGVQCVDGHCGGKRGVGAACDNNEQCDKGYCVDGVCCENACAGNCMACASAATGRADGTCAPATAGTDPRNKCDSEAGCGQDGTCDGRGACRKRGAETTCLAAACDGDHTFSKAATCNGGGACATASATDCGLYRCNATGCGQAPCASDNDCAMGAAFCDTTTHQCVTKKALGTVCVHDDDCNGGPCVKGICCDNACTTGCHSCNSVDTGGAMGRCLPVVAGKSDGTCTAKPEATCKETGACDGKGACQLQPATVECQAESCTGSTYTPPSKCDGVGTCVTPGTKDCGRYLCDSGVRCKSHCNYDTDCSAQSYCTNESCVRSVCSVDDWCWFNPRPHGEVINDIWVNTPTDAWSVGNHGVIAHWDGMFWQGTKSVTEENLLAVHGSAGIIWATGSNGTILKWDGLSWRRTTSSTTASVSDVYASGLNDAWAIAADQILHWNGTDWQISMEGADSYLWAIAGRSSSDVYAVSTSTAYHWNGLMWSPESLADVISSTVGGSETQPSDLVVEPAGDVWVTTTNDNGDPSSILHRHEGTWTVYGNIQGALHTSHISRDSGGHFWVTADEGNPYTWNINGGDTSPQEFKTLAPLSPTLIVPLAENDIFFSGSVGIFRWVNNAVSDTFIGPTDDFAGIVPNRFVLGNYRDPSDFSKTTGTLWNWFGDAFSQLTIPTSLSFNDFSVPIGASSPTTWIVGAGPTILRQSDYLPFTSLMSGSSRTDSLLAVSANAKEAWMVGPGGRVWRADVNGLDTSPISGTTVELTDVVTIGTTDVWVVGFQGTSLHKAGTGPFVPAATGTTSSLNAICANNPQDIWAVGSQSVALHWTGSNWMPAGQGLASVKNFSDVVCLGNETWATQPSQAWHWKDGSWTMTATGAGGTRISASADAIWIAGSNGALLQHAR